MSQQRRITTAGAVLAITAVLASLSVPVTASAAGPSPVAGKITTIVHEGNEIILNPDSTWAYKSAAMSVDESGEAYIPLNDNRILWLKSDYTWAFVKSQPPKSNRPKTYPNVEASGTSTVQSLDVAIKTAVNQVYDKLATNLSKYIMSKDKRAKDYLLACIKNEVNENEFDKVHNQIKGGSWKADAKVSIYGYRVKEIIDCLDTQLAPAEEESAAKDAAKEADKKKK